MSSFEEHATIENNQLKFSYLNRSIHNGLYKCQIELTTGEIFASNVSNMTIYGTIYHQIFAHMLSNHIIILKARPKMPEIIKAIRLEDGVELSWNISDIGDLVLTNLKYYWTNDGFSSRNISTTELYGDIRLFDIPCSAKTIQILISNRLGESPLSESFKIGCGYKGCEDSKSNTKTEAIIAGVVCSLVGIAIGIFIGVSIASRKLKKKYKQRNICDDEPKYQSPSVVNIKEMSNLSEIETSQNIVNIYERVDESSIVNDKIEPKIIQKIQKKNTKKTEEKAYETLLAGKRVNANYLKPEKIEF